MLNCLILYRHQTIGRLKGNKSKAPAKPPEDDARVEESKKVIEDLKKHEKTWKAFFMTLGEDVWNVPFKARKINIEKEWENTSGILSEVKLLSLLNRPAKKRFWISNLCQLMQGLRITD